jgi:DNA-binding transcriptional MocR family regulator
MKPPQSMAKRVTADLLIRLDSKAAGTLQHQIYAGVRRAILDGVVAPGTRLPSSRALATDLGISRTTSILAPEQLLAEGYPPPRQGSGTTCPRLPTIFHASAVRPWRGKRRCRRAARLRRGAPRRGACRAHPEPSGWARLPSTCFRCASVAAHELALAVGQPRHSTTETRPCWGRRRLPAERARHPCSDDI